MNPMIKAVLTFGVLITLGACQTTTQPTSKAMPAEAPKAAPKASAGEYFYNASPADIDSETVSCHFSVKGLTGVSFSMTWPSRNETKLSFTDTSKSAIRQRDLLIGCLDKKLERA